MRTCIAKKVSKRFHFSRRRQGFAPLEVINVWVFPFLTWHSRGPCWQEKEKDSALGKVYKIAICYVREYENLQNNVTVISFKNRRWMVDGTIKTKIFSQLSWNFRLQQGG